ncbi:MAG: Fic family protein [Sphaerochaetaceae bacterium]
MYIYEHRGWPHFIWKKDELLAPLSAVTFQQGRVLGRMKELGFDLQRESSWHVVTQNVITSSEIEGEHLDYEQVQSSVARHLNISFNSSNPMDHHVEGVVEMMFDAFQNYQEAMSEERLYRWHGALFPTGFSGIRRIAVGQLRTDTEGPMQVVSQFSGPMERVHFQAPPAKTVSSALSDFLVWFNGTDNEIPFIKAAIAHLWFVTIHPFEDGNGRITRALTDMLLCRADQSSYRFYSMSVQIQKQKNDYYHILEKTQKSSLDITAWLVWFLHCLELAIKDSESVVDTVLQKAWFWRKSAQYSLGENQRKMLQLFLDDFKGNLTSSKWARICKVSQDTAGRELKDLVEKGLLRQEGQGRSTHYVLVKEEQ